MRKIEVGIHTVPGVDVRAATRDLIEYGAVGIDDIAEKSYEDIRWEILNEIGHAADFMDLRTTRVNAAYGPVFVIRNAAFCTAAEVRRAVLAERGGLDRSKA